MSRVVFFVILFRKADKHIKTLSCTRLVEHSLLLGLRLRGELLLELRLLRGVRQAGPQVLLHRQRLVAHYLCNKTHTIEKNTT